MKVSVNELKNMIYESIVKALSAKHTLSPYSSSNSPYNNGVKCLNEMAQVNKNEKGMNKKHNFNADLYRVYVKGEGAYQKFPHFHIEMPSEGWDIRMNMDGTLHSIKRKCQNRQNPKDFSDIVRIAVKWLNQPNSVYSGMTNGEAAQFLWDTMN